MKIEAENILSIFYTEVLLKVKKEVKKKREISRIEKSLPNQLSLYRIDKSLIQLFDFYLA